MFKNLRDILGLNCGIYFIKNKTNNKVYVGSSKNLQRRMKFHFRSLESGGHHSKKLQRAYDKYGKDSFCHEVIEYCEPNDLCRLEKEWIDYFNSFKNGYNSTDETIAPWRGKKLPVHIKKLQKCTPVKIISPDGILVEDYSLSNFCKKNNLHISAISDVLKERTLHFKGWRKYSKELIGSKFNYTDYYRNRGDKQATITCDLVNPNGELIKIKNLTRFAKENNLDLAALHRVVKGKNKHCWGYRLANEKTLGVKCIPKLLRKKYVE